MQTLTHWVRYNPITYVPFLNLLVMSVTCGSLIEYEKLL